MEEIVDTICPICEKQIVDRFGEPSKKVLCYHVEVEHEGYCHCGILLENHRRCVACGIYIGQDHFEQNYVVREGRMYCSCCSDLCDRYPRKMRKYSDYAAKEDEEWQELVT